MGVTDYLRNLVATSKLKLAGYPLWLQSAFFVGFVFAVILFISAVSVFSAKDWLSAFGTLVASFFGAVFAFSFAKYQRNEERIQDEVAAGNRALFILTQMYSETKQYQRDVVSPYRGKQDAWLNLHIGPQLNKSLAFIIEDLSFVLEHSPQMFADVILEGSRFRNIANIIDDHRQLIVSQVWPRLEAAGLKIGDSRPDNELEEIIGPSVISQLKVTTSSIIKFIDENERSLKSVFQQLRTTLKSIYPTKKFIDFKPID